MSPKGARFWAIVWGDANMFMFGEKIEAGFRLLLLESCFMRANVFSVRGNTRENEARSQRKSNVLKFLYIDKNSFMMRVPVWVFWRVPIRTEASSSEILFEMSQSLANATGTLKKLYTERAISSHQLRNIHYVFDVLLRGLNEVFFA